MIRTVPKSNREIIETWTNWIHIIHIHSYMMSHFAALKKALHKQLLKG